MNSKTKAAPNGSGNTSRISSVRRNKDNKRALPPPKEKGCFLSYLTGFLVQPLKYLLS